MEESKSSKSECCLGCLGHKNEYSLQCYEIQSEPLKTSFQINKLYLCYICKRKIHNVEQFIQNVQSNQIFLENFCSFTDNIIEIARDQSNSHITLTSMVLEPIAIDEDNTDLEEPLTIIYSSRKDVKVKAECKEEDGFSDIDEEFIDDDNFPETLMKEEDDFPLKDFIKKENSEYYDGMQVIKLRKKLKKGKIKKKIGKIKDNLMNERKSIVKSCLTVLHITKEQCLKEREKSRENEKYLNSLYKCENCIKGFTFKEGYDKHMENHSKAMGEFECDICKLRMDTMEKLSRHQRYHKVRYKCNECGLTRVSRLTVKDHFTAFHSPDTVQYKCSQCDKKFKRQLSLRKHVAYAHKNTEREKCQYCDKTYANNNVLKSHLLRKHTEEVIKSEGQFKSHICEECGATFKAPSQLKNHMIKHSASRDYYCVECDRRFKSDAALKQHLKIAAPHINYMELPLQCKECSKRFVNKRDLERHMNSIHLDIKPYQCDVCDKKYVNAWSLTEHKRFTHEGHKRPLKFPCPFCDKVFDRAATCKSHVRVHTGERPYACGECGARFSQPGVRATHVRRVHRKHARATVDARPG